MEYKLLNKREFEKYLIQFEELFNLCFNREIDKSYFHWRYLNNTMNDLLVYVALDNGKLIGNYSVFPCEINIKGEIRKVGLSMTTMTHPNYKGKGIFTTLANKLYQRMKNEGYAAVFGFPNNNSHKIFVNKLGWTDIYEIPSLSTINTNREYINSNNTIILDNKFELDYSIFIDTCKNIHINKNNQYLKWRFFDNPINDYDNYVLLDNNKLIANCVIKFYNNEMDIVEINCVDYEKIHMFINNIISLNKEKIIKVNTWMNVTSEFHNVYEKLGFINREPITYFGIKKLDKSLNEDIYNYKEWFIQMSDSDVY